MVIKVALVGCGYWGKNLHRNLVAHPNISLDIVCDFSTPVLEKFETDARKVASLDDVLYSDVDAVVIATPASTHYELTHDCLSRGKHVLVEKPLAFDQEDAEELFELARKKNLKLMCDHTWLYTEAVNIIKKHLDNYDIGSLLSIKSSRANYGKFQRDVDVVWDLSPHDISIIAYLLPDLDLDDMRIYGNTIQEHHYNSRKAVEADYSLVDSNMNINIHNSWVSPFKRREMVFTGTKGIIVWDDLKDEYIKVVKRDGVELGAEEETVTYTKPASGEALYDMVDEFVSMISGSHKPKLEKDDVVLIVKTLSLIYGSLT